MDIKINLAKVYAMDNLIHMKATGNPKEFADKIDVSEATIYNYLRTLKELDIPIEYCSIRRTYYYKEAGRIAFHFCKNEKKQKSKKYVIKHKSLDSNDIIVA